VKYGYVYVGVSVAIVVIGIFLIFQLESTKQNSTYCKSMEEAKLFYSQFNVTLKFPQYLPDDYRYKCSVFETSTDVISFYDNKTTLNPPRTGLEVSDYFKNGGLYFGYDKINSKDYYLFLSQIENGTKRNLPYNYSEINGNPAIVSGGMYLGSTIYMNKIAVYTKDSLSTIEGNFTMVELKKLQNLLDDNNSIVN